MINKIDLGRVPNFIVLEIYFIFDTTFSWNEGIDTCFNVNLTVILIFLRLLDGTARYLVVIAG